MSCDLNSQAHVVMELMGRMVSCRDWQAVDSQVGRTERRVCICNSGGGHRPPICAIVNRTPEHIAGDGPGARFLHRCARICTHQAGICFSHEHHLFYACPAFRGDSGAALLLNKGRLVGLHVEVVNALRERLDRQKVVDKLTEVEESLDAVISGLGLRQGCVAVLAKVFAT